MNTLKFVLPSGVECETSKLMGLHQRLLTEGNNANTGKGINLMLADVLVRVGTRTGAEISEKFVQRMLSVDRKFALLLIRQFSIPARFKDVFEFDYEFPTKSGNKYKQHFNVAFGDDDYPARPYCWVRERMRDTLNAAGIPEEEHDYRVMPLMPGHAEFPVMYETYEQALDNAARVFKLPDSGINVHWQMLTGETEENLSKIQDGKISTHTPLEVHTLVTMEEPKKEGGNPQPRKLNLDKLSLEDIEELRLHINQEEGAIDTLLTLQHRVKTDLINTVDLVGQAAFFFPSQAV